MTTIESKKVVLQATPEEVFNFLSDVNNFEKIMPEQVEHWESNSDEFKFTLKGMPPVSMKVVNRVIPSLIQLGPAGKAPFDFSLKVQNTKVNDGAEVQFVFEASLNPFYKMMVERPLSNFINMLSEKIKDFNKIKNEA